MDVRNSVGNVMLLVIMAGLPLTARAQGGGDGYLFGRPTGTITLRGGFASPSANSDVFSFTSKQLTVGRGDFSSGTIGLDMGVRVSDRVDLQVGISAMGRTVNSEFRKFVDNKDKPIEQRTGFVRVPLTAGVKLYLTPPGRSISRLAWIPSRFTPYVGAGGGMMWYQFEQTGDFVNFQTLDVFSDKLTSSAWTPTAYGSAGVDYSLSTHLSLTTEGRYDVARSTMSSSFEGFNRIDLSGFTANVGLSVRF